MCINMKLEASVIENDKSCFPSRYRLLKILKNIIEIRIKDIQINSEISKKIEFIFFFLLKFNMI